MKKLIFTIIVIFISICPIYADTEKFIVEFSDCVDGDTFKALIDDKEFSIRMLAVDTPETVKPGTEVEYYGKEASDYTCNTLTNANKIELEYDEGSDKSDKYDRILAWVYVDDSLLQGELVSLGYGKVEYIYGDYKYTEDLYTLEEIAKENNTGLWTEDKEISSEIKDSSEETFWDELEDLVNSYIKKWVKGLIIDLTDYINKLIKEVFN